MSKPVRRQGSVVYYARRAIPKELREAYGRREFWKSLGTTDFDTAKSLERLQQIAWDQEFSAAKAKPHTAAPVSLNRPPLTLAERDERERLQHEWERENDAYCAESYPEYEDLPPEEQRIRDAVETARDRWEQQQQREREFERQERRAEANRKKAGLPASTPAVGTPLSAVVARWAANKTNQKTIDRMTKVVEWFEDDMGRVSVEEITPEMVDSWVEKLLKRTSPSNARTKLSNFKALLRVAWLKARLIKANPAFGVTVDFTADPEDDVQPFDLPALKAIFSSPVYIANERPDAGAGEAAYWLPLLALYTGARLNELGQLRPADVIEIPYLAEGGEEQVAWCIRIVADKKEGLRLKNAFCARRVPIHSDVIALGFLDFVNAAREAGQARVFPELRPDKYGTVTANWSKWFGRYLRGTIKVTDDRMRFHSFRHAFKDYAREAEIPEDVNDAFTGHRGQAVARRYGSTLNYPLRPMVAAMAKYRVTGLTLPVPPPAYRKREVA
jgi:integrase